ncbi:MAG: hypothetical protein Q9163_000369 [Psora crenata]
MDHSDAVETVLSAERMQGQERDDTRIVQPVAEDAVVQGTSRYIRQENFQIPKTPRDWTSHVLRFLSNASNEALGVCMVGLGTTTYLILGRVGLVLIGFVGGLVLHAVWEGTGADKALEARERREKGLDVVKRVLDWRNDSNADQEGFTGRDISGKPILEGLDLSNFPPETKGALDGLTGAILRDYVHWWYGPILPNEESFPFACRQTLNRFLLSLSGQLSRKRPADVFLDFLTNSSSIVIVFLSELSNALAASRGLEPQELINDYLVENPDGSLANVLDEKQQKKKLKAVAEDILQAFLDTRAYACEPVRAFLREVLAGLILDSTITSCSAADFINEWIIFALEEKEGEATDLAQAIVAGVGEVAGSGATQSLAATANGEPSASTLPPESSTVAQSPTKTEHRRTVSRAEEAMEEAVEEAKRLTELIAEEEAKKAQGSEEDSSSRVDFTAQALPNSSEGDGSNAAGAPTTTFAENNDGTIESSTAVEAISSFKSFDQMLSSQEPTALRSQAHSLQPLSVAPLTLHNATVSIYDDSAPGEKGGIRSKPVAEYLLQIEPTTSQYPGWMIARKYADFETLHEVLRRISVVSGIAVFTERHQSLPGWRSKTKSSLRTDLEKYLQDALSFQRLAESEGMKRFLEKDQHLGKTSPSTNKGAFGFPNPAAFESMGKGMLDVLASAPKGAAVGGKAIVGGVTGVLGGVGSLGQKKQAAKSPITKATHHINGSVTVSAGADSNVSSAHGDLPRRPSRDSYQQPIPSQNSLLFSIDEPNTIMEPAPQPKRQSFETGSQKHKEPSAAGCVEIEASPQELQARDLSSNVPPLSDQYQLRLPPPPSEISDDYSTNQASPRPSLDDQTTLRTSISTVHSNYSPSRRSTTSSTPQADAASSSLTDPAKRLTRVPLTIQETSVAVELFFATVNELYTLSSAWTLRLTLLNTAKSFLLRPGNSNLEAIRQLLQSTVIDPNTSDAGIASHINKIRENALPTEEERKAWPPQPSEEEKERTRAKARRLLVEKGMPQALTSVMGQAASGEALGKVFDCLQTPQIARGLASALVLQAVKALTQ